jgi:uncharacterized protein
VLPRPDPVPEPANPRPADLAAALLVLAKEPLPGRAKTRLTPPLTPLDAAALAEAALADTLETVAGTPVTHRFLVLDGAVGPWLPAGFSLLEQRGDGLDERLAAAFDDAGAAAPGLPLLLVGMDTPQVTPDLLANALGALLAGGTDAVLGAAADGGWWALGLRRPDPSLLLGVPMSTPGTGQAQRDRLLDAGLRVHDLPVLRDVDTAADAEAVARIAPESRFAVRLAAADETSVP